MKGYISNIEKDTLDNGNYRKVIYTTTKTQLVLMNLRAGEEIGEEVHEHDQFIRIESGSGSAVLNGIETAIADGSAILVPAGVKHNIINTSEEPLKLYTLYAPPEHKDGIVQPRKSDEKEEHFDGITTE